ncbi:cytochrome P450 [Nocardia otitidiscaviarum]|uniref:cytochrome P450 n=1 Tax=Nocardia otitidiscaviarum TaxID=1823 RepID=UPI0004A6FF00|nr:cytochrome P450 [Nocardia otitidiscaviarum]MBF6137774.1 cytochrome P450 [Nocardia otitidiscaviarum]MBF6485295.1 cytochrome P450 [Nocardia otitidiscaviarum]
MNAPPVLTDAVPHNLPGFLAQTHHRQQGRPFAVPGMAAEDPPTVFCVGPPAVQQLFAQEHTALAVHNTPAVHSLFRRAVFTLRGKEHAAARSFLAGGLRHEVMTAYLPAVAATARQHVAAWEAQPVVRLYEVARTFTMDVCVSAILGLHAADPAALLIPDLFDRFVAGTEVPADLPSGDPIYTDALRAADELRTALRACVFRSSLAGTPSVVSKLVSARRAPGGEVVDHLLALLIAARETTASLLTWFLIECALDAPLTEALASEAQALLADPILAAHRGAAPGLRAVLAECLRLHTPNTLAIRVATQKLEVGGYTIPAGWHVAYSAPATGLLPDLHENPETFAPQRFTGLYGPRQAAGLLAFGRGAHACAGRGFAAAVTLVAVAAVLAAHRVDLLTAQRPAVLRYQPVRTPAGPVHARIHRQVHR